MTICSLCAVDKPLIKSHIVPKAFYPAPTNEGVPVLLPSDSEAHVKRSPIGVYDEHILCASCDGKLGVFDQHVIEKLLHGNFKTLPNKHVRQYVGADALLVIKFIASVAWRANASSNSSYDSIRLGPYRDKLRRVFECGELDESIGFVVAEMTDFSVKMANSSPPFLNPCNIKIHGVNYLVIYSGRFVFYVRVDKRRGPTWMSICELIEGTPVLSILRDWDTSNEADLILNMFQKNERMQNLSKIWSRNKAEILTPTPGI